MMTHIEKDKNEPGRFLGEGVSFRAKLIGVLEVPEARGDRMCQEALADLKMAIRAAGEHKQRIQVHVAIDGLRLRDDKTGDSLYHHPVHKISFIAQDMTDSRAFGYIFGSPDTGHRFFGIKTDKAASQVVIAMRDLFQVVFELKKKEIELAKQQLEGKTVTSGVSRHAPSAPSETKSKALSTVGESISTSAAPESAEGGVAELVDLEQELSSLRRGLTQVEGLTPPADPFGDSFIVPGSSGAQRGLLPPPPSGSSTRGRSTPAASTSTRAIFSPNKTALPFDLTTVAADFEPVVPSAATVVEAVEPPELKNPPKKQLKDLVHTTNSPLLADVATEKPDYSATLTSLSRQSGGTVTIAKPSSMYSGGFFSSDPFAETDPFDAADPFSDSFKDDPFMNLPEFPKPVTVLPDKARLRDMAIDRLEERRLESVAKNVFNGPLQVSLPPEPAPKSPRLQRQSDSGSIRQRPQPASKLATESASPPPPLPPKKPTDVAPGKPPPVPPHDTDDSEGPPLPPPSRKKEPKADRSTKPRLSSITYSSSEEYLPPCAPPPPPARRFDITLAQLLTCSMPELAHRLHVPEETLSSMTLPQLTTYLRSYLASDVDKAKIHRPELTEQITEPPKISKEYTTTLPEYTTSHQNPPKTASLPKPIKETKKLSSDQFEDNFAPTNDSSTPFVANFDDFDQKAGSSYDRYAVFREIQEQELKTRSILDPLDDEKQNGDADQKQDSDKEEVTSLTDTLPAQESSRRDEKEQAMDISRSPIKSLDELTLDSFNMFRNSVSPKPTNQIDSKIEDIKNVMKTLQIEQARRSVSPRDTNLIEQKQDDNSDRYAALREITITEPPDEFESLPPEAPKERKRSDEKSDGFDNSDFFDCIDNSSLSFSHVDEAFRKSPSVPRDKVEEKLRVDVSVSKKSEVLPKKEPMNELQPPPRLSAGSLSDVASASSPDTKGNYKVRGEGRWSVLAARASWSSDSRDSDVPWPRRAPAPPIRTRQTSSSSRDVSPWEEEPPPAPRHHRAAAHHRESRHNSSQGSRECLDSGSGRDKDKKRDKRDRDMSRDGRESVSTRERDRKDSVSTRERDRRDSGSGRDRRDSKDREYREKRDRRSRDRDTDVWDRDREYSRDRERDYRDSRSRERERLPKDYRDKERDRYRKPHHSWDDDDEYSDGCGSGRSSPRDRYPEHRYRRDERNYGSLGWRESRRRAELRLAEDPDRRYGATMSWSRRSGAPPARRDDRRRRHDRTRARDQRFSNDFSPRDREHSPFDNDFVDTPSSAGKKRGPYSSLEGTRFAFEAEETASPMSANSTRARDGDSPATRFRFDSDSVSPRSMFEDDFTAPAPRPKTASIAEEDEGELPPLRNKPPQQHRDIKKSESVNIFVRETDPFEGDDFFACTGSDKVARRENWPGDFQAFDNV
ncbi:hypothetical protein JYU34_014451 [Plutella xylostella]|uniref:PID domain-containing protein n=1 Tax=Plutella xylostella TaxID=51655 RepID=A0ABQ7Q9Q7_PLUXY|nr:hypothetical protein JYU34_014451 [Plutella xylostella]